MNIQFSKDYSESSVAWLWDGYDGLYAHNVNIGRLKDIRDIIGSFAQNYHKDINGEFIYCTIEILKSNINNVPEGKRFKFRLYKDKKFAIRNN